MEDRIILHADVNNFYASVAIKLNPALRGKPIVICGDIEKRHGIILAKSNEAKKYGIKTGDTLMEAKNKCHSVIFVPPDYKQYTRISDIIYNLYKDYTPLVESFGLDECWLDVTKVTNIFGNGEKIAYLIKERVKKVTGLTISIGVSFTKIFAKLGSDLKKPDAVSIISRENYKTVAWNLPATDMLFVGKNMKKKLSTLGIYTIGDIAKANRMDMISHFGKVGEKLHDASNGIEWEQVGEYNAIHVPDSVSNGTTTEVDIDTEKFAASVIYSLCEVIATRLRMYRLKANGVYISIKLNDLTSFCKQIKIFTNTDDAQTIAETALKLLLTHYSFGEDLPIRAITVGSYGLTNVCDYSQNTIFDDEQSKCEVINEKLDRLRTKYGYGILRRAIEINPNFSCDTKEIDEGFLPFDKARNKIDE